MNVQDERVAQFHRLQRAYAEAGADCLYAPRIGTVEHVAAVVAAVTPKPVNLLINAPFITVAEAAALGVRRISVGGTLARTAWAGFLQAARESQKPGRFPGLSGCPTSMRCSALDRPQRGAVAPGHEDQRAGPGSARTASSSAPPRPRIGPEPEPVSRGKLL